MFQGYNTFSIDAVNATSLECGTLQTLQGTLQFAFGRVHYSASMYHNAALAESGMPGQISPGNQRA